jgi:hypothetical protein
MIDWLTSFIKRLGPAKRLPLLDSNRASQLSPSEERVRKRTRSEQSGANVPSLSFAIYWLISNAAIDDQKMQLKQTTTRTNLSIDGAVILQEAARPSCKLLVGGSRKALLVV